jgi:hypothetical protein
LLYIIVTIAVNSFADLWLESPWYPLDRRLGGPQSQSGCGGKEKNSLPLLGLKPLIIQPIAQCYTTKPLWLLVFKLGTSKIPVSHVTVEPSCSVNYNGAELVVVSWHI